MSDQTQGYRSGTGAGLGRWDSKEQRGWGWSSAYKDGLWALSLFLTQTAKKTRATEGREEEEEEEEQGRKARC